MYLNKHKKYIKCLIRYMTSSKVDPIGWGENDDGVIIKVKQFEDFHIAEQQQ